MRRIESPHGSIVLVVEPPGTPTFTAGRRALCEALGEQLEIGRDDRGAPIVPRGHGSIAHKTGAERTVAAAIWSPSLVGIDLERAQPPRQPIERRILTPRELAAFGADRRRVSLAFAIKEAIYKAVDPVVRRYVGFTEVELDLEAGRATSQLPLEVAFWWTEVTDPEPLWLATARATRRP
ncbi:MAG TPA: 4'-phosphopantetheinyl transferase superfamily protein [Kofleriaceae bacterium]|nr:4'-phosphopantetheinyl transferase superfamily protein [Kofleriaceae bacterium]